MDTLPQHISELIRPAAEAIGLSPEEFDRGIESLNFWVARLGLEAAQAESQSIALSDAVRRNVQFPEMSRVHIALGDIFEMEVPHDIVPLARETRRALLAAAPVENVRYALAEAACNLPRNSALRALARFGLFEAVRMNLLVASTMDRPALAGAEIGDLELSRIAEHKVQQLIEAQEEIFAGVEERIRPLEVIVAAALADLTGHLEALAPAGHLSEQIRENWEMRAEFERRLQGLNPKDVYLLRNWAGLGEERLSPQQLAERHPLIFPDAPTQNSLEQRLSRARKRISANDTPAPTGALRFLDIMNQLEDDV